MQDLKNTLGREEVEGIAAQGKIKVIMNGNQDVRHVSIDPALLNDAASLEVALSHAFNDAIEKSRKLMVDKMKGFDDIPGLSI